MTLPEGFSIGPIQGLNIVGEVTEAFHKFLLDGWTATDRPAPRIEEDLSFVPKDREEVIYVYMYRVAENSAIKGGKQWRPINFEALTNEMKEKEIAFQTRNPLCLEVYYLVAVHAKFRSDAERLLGWLMTRLYDASHVIYRPTRFILPDGRQIDTLGRPWSKDAEGDVEMERVSLALVNDMTIGDAINFFTIHEAPYRPFLTYRALVVMDGQVLQALPTTVRTQRLQSLSEPGAGEDRPSGRLGRVKTQPSKRPTLGPEGQNYRPLTDNDSEG